MKYHNIYSDNRTVFAYLHTLREARICWMICWKYLFQKREIY